MVTALAAKGIGVLLVEQFFEVALSLAPEVVVLCEGVVRLLSDPTKLRADSSLLTAAYLYSVVSAGSVILSRGDDCEEDAVQVLGRLGAQFFS